jgi:hypothetical protein
MAIATGILERLCERYVKVEGELGYFGLGHWWLSALTRSQRAHVEEVFRAPGAASTARPLTRGQSQRTFRSAAGLLTALAGCLRNTPEDRTLAARILAKAEERAKAEDDTLGLHFAYQEMIRLHFKWRDRFVDALDLTFGACHKQIAIAPQAAEAFRRLTPEEDLPTHAGFQQLATLQEQQAAYAKAIELCKQARDQGWPGNWTWRIGCLAKKQSERGPVITNMSRSGLTRI